MLGVAEADLQLEGGFVRVKGAPGMRKIARRACRRERSAFRGFTMARGRVARGPGALSSPQTGDRGFESISLQRRVRNERYPQHAGSEVAKKQNAFAHVPTSLHAASLGPCSVRCVRPPDQLFCDYSGLSMGKPVSSDCFRISAARRSNLLFARKDSGAHVTSENPWLLISRPAERMPSFPLTATAALYALSRATVPP